MNNYITVQVTKVPGAMKTVTLEEENNKVSDAIAAAELEVAQGYEVRVDDEVANLETRLEDGAVVVITKMIKGN